MPLFERKHINQLHSAYVHSFLQALTPKKLISCLNADYQCSVEDAWNHFDSKGNALSNSRLMLNKPFFGVFEADERDKQLSDRDHFFLTILHQQALISTSRLFSTVIHELLKENAFASIKKQWAAILPDSKELNLADSLEALKTVIMAHAVVILEKWVLPSLKGMLNLSEITRLFKKNHSMITIDSVIFSPWIKLVIEQKDQFKSLPLYFAERTLSLGAIFGLLAVFGLIKFSWAFTIVNTLFAILCLFVALILFLLPEKNLSPLSPKKNTPSLKKEGISPVSSPSAPLKSTFYRSCTFSHDSLLKRVSKVGKTIIPVIPHERLACDHLLTKNNEQRIRF